MTHSRRKFTAEQKAAIVWRHLKAKKSIATIAEELSIQPTQIHQWVAVVMEQQIRRLQEKLIHKNEVIAELMEENVRAKKPMGTSRRRLGPPRYSRQDCRLHEVLDRAIGHSMQRPAEVGQTANQQVPHMAKALRKDQ